MVDLVVAELAARQCGVFARCQVIDAGGDDSLVRRRRRSGRWHTCAPGVYGLPGYAETWDRRLWIAYLAAGVHSVVSHEAAAALYRLPGFLRRMITLTVPHPEHQRVAGAVVHQTRSLPDHHWINLFGRRTTTLARTLVDLAPRMSRARLDAAYEHALVTDHLTQARMSRCFTELLVPGRRGMAKLGSVLDARGPGFVPAASELERMLFETCRLAGLADPVRQFPLPGRAAVTGCVDGAYVEAGLILEADGRRWHTRVGDFARDRARDKEAARVGWQTLRFCHEELTEDPDGEAEAIRETYDQRLALLA
jgi:very-short-patch-repair endonuclease